MSLIKNIWDKIRHAESVLYPTFEIPQSNLLDENKNVGQTIIPQKSYFEISLTQQFLKDKRQYWNEYIPLTLFFTEFIYANQRSAFPFVVGPELLKSLEQLEGNESIRYKNTRVLGPTPYIGDNVALFIGLFRVKTKDWAAQTIGLLETVAKSFDTSKLTSYLNIAQPLLTGIENFFDMGKQMQFRLGQRDEFRDSSVHSTNQFRSGYWVMVRTDENTLDKKKFWIKDSQLYYGDHKDNLKPYRGNDYALFEISKLDKRPDYITFDFHKHWESVRKAVIEKNIAKADSEFQNIMVKLFSSHDIIESQKNQLYAMYMGQFEQIKSIFLKTASIQDVLKNLNLNRELFNTRGLNAQLNESIMSFTSDYVQNTADVFAQKDYIIDEQFIQDALDHPLLNDKALLELNSYEIRDMKPTIDIMRLQ